MVEDSASQLPSVVGTLALQECSMAVATGSTHRLVVASELSLHLILAPSWVVVKELLL